MISSNDTETTLKVALSMTKGVTLPVVARMTERGVTLEDFFTQENLTLGESLGLPSGMTFDRYSREQALYAARNEVEFMSRHSIEAVFIGDREYPWRMAECSDAPILLYKLGECDLNGEHMLSVVGTRKITPYGQEMGRRIVKETGEYFPDLCVVSGLAYGADAVAHTVALEEGLATVAVVAHGLNTIYPAAHRDLAKRIVKSGGAIVSEYPCGTSAYRRNFLARNRIVAWMSDATVIIESEIKGGAMSTANHAFRENRDVFAVPGRSVDPMSAGCNHLIRRHKASLVTSAADIIEATGWRPLGVAVTPEMRCLFPELEGNEKKIYDMLLASDAPQSADSIHAVTRIPIGELASVLSEMEFEGIILRHPGNRFTTAG